MVSRDPRPEPRALDSRRRWRLFAIAAWSSFLGASLILLVDLSVLPRTGNAGLADLSVGFLITWVLCMVPVSMALLLATTPPGRPHG